MRVVSVDQFEFENPSTEESLEIAVASRSAFPFPDAQHFVASRVGVAAAASLPQPIAFNERLACGLLRKYTERFVGVLMPEPCTWPTYVLSDGPDEWNLVLCGPGLFVHYLWSTSA